MNLKKILTVILSCITNYACGPGVSVNFVEEEAKEHLEKFNQIYNLNVKIEIRYKDLPDRIAGLCYTYKFQPNNIEIDETIFKSYDYYGRQELVFHELGHCILNRDHDDSLITLKGVLAPNSIMYPFVFGQSNSYKQNLDYYYEELIRGK